MPDYTTWPPKPDLPDPLTEYDELIAAKIAALSETKAGPSRLLLTKALREEKGLDLRQAYAFVTDYCDRHGVLVRPKTSPTIAWLGCLVPLLVFCFVAFNLYLGHQRDAILRLPHHHVALLALDREKVAIASVGFALALLNTIFQVIRFRRNRKK